LLPSTGQTAVLPPWLTIAGVAPTLQQRLAVAPDPMVYVPLRGAPPPAVIALARGSSDTAATAGALRDVVPALNPDLPAARLMPMEQAIAEAQWPARGSTKISETVVLIAILLAAAGLYAVTAHAVVLRSAEISVRRALGARASHIVQLVGRRAAMQVAIGSALGVAGATAWERATGASIVDDAAGPLVDPIALARPRAVVPLLPPAAGR